MVCGMIKVKKQTQMRFMQNYHKTMAFLLLKYQILQAFPPERF